jgi:dihydropteroate synthase type 2
MTTILGIVNLSAESFSDGGQFMNPAIAAAHAHALIKAGAAAVDLGPSSSHPGVPITPSSVEIERLAPVLDVLLPSGISLSVDSFHPQTQRYVMARGVDFLNDIHGFAHPDFYPELAASKCRLIVMHNVHGTQAAERVVTDSSTIMSRIFHFFHDRLAALISADISQDRLIIDPGMGFFLSSEPEASLTVLQHLADLRAEFALPVLVGVSRKSFIQRMTGRSSENTEFGTLSAELFAAAKGVDWIRTHNVGALQDGLTVSNNINEVA